MYIFSFIKNRICDFISDNVQWGSCLLNVILCLCMGYFYFDSDYIVPLLYAIFFFFLYYCCFLFWAAVYSGTEGERAVVSQLAEGKMIKEVEGVSKDTKTDYIEAAMLRNGCRTKAELISLYSLEERLPELFPSLFPES